MADSPFDPAADEVLPLHDLIPVAKLTRDLRQAARTLTTTEARWLVDVYYQSQRDRIRAGHQQRTTAEGGEPHEVLSWLGDQRMVLERQVAGALDAYSAGHPVGVWARSITGIGPIISAGLIANIYVGLWCQTCHGQTKEMCDARQANKKLKLPAHSFAPVESCPTVGHIWRFAGLDPTVKWSKNTKRPWNGALKRLCWLIGESFVKVSNLERDTYGKIYVARKAQENQRNDAGRFADQAKASLSEKKFGEDTQARKFYEQGKLPPARIHLRAERYAVKLFLSALHEVWFFSEFGRLPPKPYVIEHLGHAHYIAPPNMHLIPGLVEARQAAGLPA
jgi:hypothetical protein